MKKSFWLPIALGLMAYLVLPLPGIGAPLSDRIDQKQHEIDAAKQKEGVLTTTIQSFSTRIDGLQGRSRPPSSSSTAPSRASTARRTELLQVRDRLEVARDRLARLRSELATARKLLAARLVEIYKSDTPDALTVVLESDGFGDLLERAEFLQRISDQDRKITDRVRGLRDLAQGRRCSSPSSRSASSWPPSASFRQRDQIASAENQLVSSRDQLASARADKRGAAGPGARRQADRDGGSRLAPGRAGARGGRPPGRAAADQAGLRPADLAGQRAGHRRRSASSGPDTSTPASTSPSRRARRSARLTRARVALMGWVGGYGNYTCIQHTATMSTCYGHQSRFATSNGASVSQGQVIGYSGNTGNSTGPHVHFEVRINGTPVDPMGYL